VEEFAKRVESQALAFEEAGGDLSKLPTDHVRSCSFFFFVCATVLLQTEWFSRAAACSQAHAAVAGG
jgi:hypothetical protein